MYKQLIFVIKKHIYPPSSIVNFMYFDDLC